MGRLTCIKPSLASLAPRIGYQPGDQRAFDKQRAIYQPLRRLYRTARWKALRLKVFVRDNFTCQMQGCGRLIGDTSMLVCDHKQPHRGSEALFWSETNLWTLCKPCHDTTKQKQERRGA